MQFRVVVLGIIILAGFSISSSNGTDHEQYSVSKLKELRSNISPDLIQLLAKPKYIIFVMELGTPSHMKPLTKLATTMKKHGHRTAFASVLDEAENWFTKTVASYDKFIRLKFTKELNSDSPKNLGQDLIDRIKKLSLSGESLLASLCQLKLIEAQEVYEGVYATLLQESNNDRPDLIVCDWMSTTCMDFARTVGIPFVITTHSSAIPTVPGVQNFLPTVFTPISPEKQTIVDRLHARFVVSLQIIYEMYPAIVALGDVRAKMGVAHSFDPSAVTVDKHIFVFNYFGFEYARYTSPFIHFLGPIVDSDIGVAAIEPSLLEWLNDVRKRSESVVYVSFGSKLVVQNETMQSLLQGLLECSVQMPSFNVLWSYGDADLVASIPAKFSGGNPRLRSEKRVNQIGVLNHPAVHLFLSHGGIESAFESILAAKPMLIYPIFADQPLVAMRIAEMGIGEQLEQTASSVQVCAKASMLVGSFQQGDSDLKKALTKASAVLYFNAQNYNKAVDVMEMEMLVGSGHLKLLEDAWPFYRRFDVDIYILLFATVLIVAYLFGKACKFAKVSTKKKTE